MIVMNPRLLRVKQCSVPDGEICCLPYLDPLKHARLEVEGIAQNIRKWLSHEMFLYDGEVHRSLDEERL